jgi:hypothetical protein
MSGLWILGGDDALKTAVEARLKTNPKGSDLFHVHLISDFSEIPADQLAQTANHVWLDAFHPSYPGFEGLKKLRTIGFKGGAFLFGEPAAESVLEPFQSDGLTGYFPPYEQADLNLVCGIVESRSHYDGDLDVSRFLKEGGRYSAEMIKSFKEFNAFGVKLATFVTRFGVNISQLKKLLMGLSLSHVKATSGTPTVDVPFKIFFGMDPVKLVVGATVNSRGVSRSALKSEFCQMIAGIRSQKALPGSLFPELYHVARAVDNLAIFGGSTSASTEGMDPMILLGALPFPTEQATAKPFSFFIFSHSEPPMVQSVEPAAAPSAESSVAPDSAPTTAVDAGSAPGSIANDEVNAILEDPVIIGDQPVVADPDNPRDSSIASPPKPAAEAVVVESHLSNEDAAELKRLKELSQTMAADIRRLMKERRQPTTDREMRDAVAQLEEKVKRLQKEKQHYAEQLEQLRAAQSKDKKAA